VGWFKSLDAKTRKRVLAYCGGMPRTIHFDLIRLALGSVANTAIFPMQDLLGLGSAHRMNTPGTVGINWHWRMGDNALSGELARRLRRLTELTGRRAEPVRIGAKTIRSAAEKD
jgi:4-alpha-glucanotransferase